MGGMAPFRAADSASAAAAPLGFASGCPTVEWPDGWCEVLVQRGLASQEARPRWSMA